MDAPTLGPFKAAASVEEPPAIQSRPECRVDQTAMTKSDSVPSIPAVHTRLLHWGAQ